MPAMIRRAPISEKNGATNTSMSKDEKWREVGSNTKSLYAYRKAQKTQNTKPRRAPRRHSSFNSTPDIETNTESNRMAGRVLELQRSCSFNDVKELKETKREGVRALFGGRKESSDKKTRKGRKQQRSRSSFNDSMDASDTTRDRIWSMVRNLSPQKKRDSDEARMDSSSRRRQNNRRGKQSRRSSFSESSLDESNNTASDRIRAMFRSKSPTRRDSDEAAMLAKLRGPVVVPNIKEIFGASWSNNDDDESDDDIMVSYAVYKGLTSWD